MRGMHGLSCMNLVWLRFYLVLGIGYLVKGSVNLFYENPASFPRLGSGMFRTGGPSGS